MDWNYEDLGSEEYQEDAYADDECLEDDYSEESGPDDVCDDGCFL